MCQVLKELMKEETAEERADEKGIDIKQLMGNRCNTETGRPESPTDKENRNTSTV